MIGQRGDDTVNPLPSWTALVLFFCKVKFSKGKHSRASQSSETKPVFSPKLLPPLSLLFPHPSKIPHPVPVRPHKWKSRAQSTAQEIGPKRFSQKRKTEFGGAAVKKEGELKNKKSVCLPVCLPVSSHLVFFWSWKSPASRPAGQVMYVTVQSQSQPSRGLWRLDCSTPLASGQGRTNGFYFGRSPRTTWYVCRQASRQASKVAFCPYA